MNLSPDNKDRLPNSEVESTTIQANFQVDEVWTHRETSDFASRRSAHEVFDTRKVVYKCRIGVTLTLTISRLSKDLEVDYRNPIVIIDRDSKLCL